MPHASVNGVRLYYEEHGAGTPLLRIHGGGSSTVFTAIKENWRYWSDGCGELLPFCPECSKSEFATLPPPG